MINRSIMADIIEAYKEYFPKHWEGENFKWKAVQHFQKHWDINTTNFGGMLEASLEKTESLLMSGYFYPKGMILGFAEDDPEATRAAFIDLYDETKDLAERIAAFQAFADDRKENHNSGWNNHYQNTNAISTYLWLRYPDKYYIYKYSEAIEVSSELESSFQPKRSSKPDNVIGTFELYDEICNELKKDEELVSMFRNALTKECYPDPELKTLTIDFGFFISRYYSQREEEWWPPLNEYDPDLSIDDWIELLTNNDIFNVRSLEIMKRLKDYGGSATCKQLAVKYGESPNFYNNGSQHLAKRIANESGCNTPPYEDADARWWPILYVGRYATEDEAGSYVWKLRDELSDALDVVDLSGIALYSEADDTDRRYWWLNASPKIWSLSSAPVGKEQTYSLVNENGNKRKIYQNFLDAKVGDIVVGYEANPVKQVVALAQITKENDGKEIAFEKTEGLSVPIDYAQLKAIPELEKMEFFINSNGSLFKLTRGEYELIMDIIREVNPISGDMGLEPYTEDDFLNDVYMTKERFGSLSQLLKNKMNIILQGAPGVGKTYAAKRLAYAMMGEKDDSRIEFVQFHQNYSYEDFIMGYKPFEDGFKLKNGIFYQFCQKAANHPEDDYFFIIDEINRGNLSKIFGELLMLIEKGYRETRTTLAYSGTQFSVPKNLYIIGMMNTADRSLALIDYALRRRFSFFEMEPGFNSDGFRDYQKSLDNETFDTLIETIKELNREIYFDDSLGPGFRIGHSYFCDQTKCTDEWMREVVYFDIIPMLQEYWFDDKQKLQRWENALTGIVND